MTEAQANQEEVGLPLASVALDLIRTCDGPQKYALHPEGSDVIKAGVQAILLSGESEDQMAERFWDVVSLCYVLREKKGCPKAADELGEALFADKRVLRILKRRGSAADERNAKSQKLLSSEALARAPKVGEKSPEDSVKLHSFLNPGQQRPKRKSNKPEAPRLAPQTRLGGSRQPTPQPSLPVAPPRHGRKA